MPTIHLLDESTINQIAAGEVVERPSAVVKELVENAVDAGATAITVEIKEGGLSFIRITDNGSGIAKEDIPTAFLRHATSKIKSVGDLLSVTSLGFRGEALSSVASVAQVELITKTPSSLNGYRYLIEGGEEKLMEEIGCPSGTTIIVRNLFFNTPARRKFLKSASTEASYISDLMERLMISLPLISFKFIVNNKVKIQSPGNNNSRDILYQVYGREIVKELLPVEYDSEEIKIKGYIGKPSINRGNRNFENYFINGRYIKSKIITKAIEDAYKPYMMQHKYPFTSLYYEIDPSLIDVNVHPQKLEIRFKNGEEVYRSTLQLIRETLGGKEMIPKISLVKEEEKKEPQQQLPEPFEEKRRRQIHEDKALYKTFDPGQKSMEHQSFYPGQKSGEHQSFDSGQKSNENKFFDLGRKAIEIKYENDDKTLDSGQKSNEYQSFHRSQKSNEFMSRDMSRKSVPGKGMEKAVLQEQPSIALPKPSTQSQVLEQLSLFEQRQSDSSEDNQKDHSDLFLSEAAIEEHKIIGQLFSTYWLVEYRKELYIIDQHAAHEKVLYERIMAGAKKKTIVSQMLLPPIVLSLTLSEQETLKKYEDTLANLGYEIEHFGGNEFSVRAVPSDLYGISEKDLFLEFMDELNKDFAGTTPESILERVASLSCKAAVKANHAFSTEEARVLIQELLTLENPYHCPHGRPVIISMSQYELERKFKRINS